MSQLNCFISGMKFKIILIIIGFISISCSSKPPVDTETENFLEVLYKMTIKAQELKDNKEELEIYMEETGKEDILTAFYQNDTVIIQELKRNYSYDAIIFSNGAGEVIVNKDLYITQNWKGDFLFSLDNVNWYLQNNDPEKNRENVDFLYDLESSFSEDRKTLSIKYSWEAILGENAKVEGLGKRELISFEEGLIFGHSDKKQINTNFKKKSLLVPKGTIITSRFILSGNLISSIFNEREIVIKAERDLFIYNGDKKIGLSFDNEKWNVSIFAFKINNDSEWYASSDNEIIMNNFLEVLYKK